MEGSFRKERPFSLWRKAFAGELETFPAGLKGMEGAGMRPAPHKSRGDPLMDGGDVGADSRLRTHILRVERRLLRRRGL